MLRKNYALCLLLVLLGVSSCQKETIITTGKRPAVADGYVRTSLNLAVADNEQVSTKAIPTEESDYDQNNVWVLVFKVEEGVTDYQSTLFQKPVKAKLSAGAYYADLRYTNSPVFIYVVTGLTDDMNNKLANEDNFEVGVTKYNDVVQNFLTTELMDLDPGAASVGVPIGNGVYFPMCSDKLSYPTGTTEVTVLKSPSESKVLLNRIVAKIDIDASTINTSNFELCGAKLTNGTNVGFVLPFKHADGYQNKGVWYKEMNTVSGNSILSQIYIYEDFELNAQKNPSTKLIVRGKYKGAATDCYYRMDLHKENGDNTFTPYYISRNTHYTVKINKIEGQGYATPEEALVNPPSNAKYTIVVDDISASDIVTNGQYYLAVSNSELVVYSDAFADIVAVKVTTDAPQSVTTNSVTVTSTGSGNLSVNTSTINIPNKYNNETTKDTEIRITIPATFTTADEGTITIKLGNLTKTIKVTRQAEHPVAGVFNDFKDDAYISGYVESTGASNWLKLSASADGSNPTTPTKKQVLSSGGIYMVIDGEIGSEALFFLSRNDDKGRVRVYYNITPGVINTPLRNMTAEQRMLNSGSHDMIFDFSNSKFETLKVRVITKTVNTCYDRRGVPDGILEFESKEFILPLPNNKKQIEVTIPKNFENNLLKQVIVQYWGADAQGVEGWISDLTPTIYQDAMPCANNYIVRYDAYPQNIHNGTELTDNQRTVVKQETDDKKATWIPVSQLISRALIHNLQFAKEAVDKAILEGTAAPGSDVIDDLRIGAQTTEARHRIAWVGRTFNGGYHPVDFNHACQGIITTLSKYNHQSNFVQDVQGKYRFELVSASATVHYMIIDCYSCQVPNLYYHTKRGRVFDRWNMQVEYKGTASYVSYSLSYPTAPPAVRKPITLSTTGSSIHPEQ